MEADLQRFYHVDLGDLYRGGLSIRRLSVLIHNLPAESRLVQTKAKTGGWDLHAHLLADLYGALAGKAHPGRPKPEGSSARHRDLVRRLQQAKERRAASVAPEGEADPV